MKLLIIGELSVVSSDLGTDINSRLGEIFMMIPENAFAGLSVMTVVVSSQFSDKDRMKHLLGL